MFTRGLRVTEPWWPQVQGDSSKGDDTGANGLCLHTSSQPVRPLCPPFPTPTVFTSWTSFRPSDCLLSAAHVLKIAQGGNQVFTPRWSRSWRDHGCVFPTAGASLRFLPVANVVTDFPASFLPTFASSLSPHLCRPSSSPLYLFLCESNC